MLGIAAAAPIWESRCGDPPAVRTATLPRGRTAWSAAAHILGPRRNRSHPSHQRRRQEAAGHGAPVIVDEIHAVVETTRRAPGAVGERWPAMCVRPAAAPQRIGLSPPKAVAGGAVPVGARRGGRPRLDNEKVGPRRALDLGIEIPCSPLEAVMSARFGKIYDRLETLVREHRAPWCSSTRGCNRNGSPPITPVGAEQERAPWHPVARTPSRCRDAAQERRAAGLVATALARARYRHLRRRLVCQLGCPGDPRLCCSGSASGPGWRPAQGRLFPLSRDE